MRQDCDQAAVQFRGVNSSVMRWRKETMSSITPERITAHYFFRRTRNAAVRFSSPLFSPVFPIFQCLFARPRFSPCPSNGRAHASFLALGAEAGTIGEGLTFFFVRCCKTFSRPLLKLLSWGLNRHKSHHAESVYCRSTVSVQWQWGAAALVHQMRKKD